MKIKLDIWLIAALVYGLGMTFVSCSDDDDEPKSEEQKEQEAEQKASNFWNVVGQLVSVDDVTDDYEGKTFEPTIGMPDATNATTRIVNTNDMQTAAQRFANLVDAKGINENTTSYKWSDPEIGSMTYTRGGDPSNWATVDVDIKAVPGLQRIIYREGGEGDNGKFSTKAYYRFGDVVSRRVKTTSNQIKTNDYRADSITEYWICVRPSFGREGKEDSHWVCVNTVTDQNYKFHYVSSNNKDYWLPTKLGTDKENMQNFAEMLYAICNPETWYKNANEKHEDGTLWGFSGVPIFTDFSRKNLDYHNRYFWQNVQEGWKIKGIVTNALNLPSFDTLSDYVKSGVHLLYNGYSWWFTTSWKCELWEAVYTNGTKDEELNLHHAEYNNPEKDMKNVNFDVREMGQNTLKYNDFFNNDGKYRWAIRHATGKELASDKKYKVDEPITGVKEEYRYYRDIEPFQNLNSGPEITNPPYADVLAEPFVGCVIGRDGKFHTKAESPIALVVYVGEKGSVETGTDYRGLAISLRNAGGTTLATGRWMSGDDYQNCTESIDPIFKAHLVNCLNGIKMTDKLVSDRHSHPAAQQCRDFTPNGNGFSDWFLPSAGQWILMAKGLFGVTWDNGELLLDGVTDYDSSDILDDILTEAGVLDHQIPIDWMWSVTEARQQNVWIVSFADKIVISDHCDKTNYLPVLPMIAF